ATFAGAAGRFVRFPDDPAPVSRRPAPGEHGAWDPRCVNANRLRAPFPETGRRTCHLALHAIELYTATGRSAARIGSTFSSCDGQSSSGTGHASPHAHHGPPRKTGTAARRGRPVDAPPLVRRRVSRPEARLDAAAARLEPLLQGARDGLRRR